MTIYNTNVDLVNDNVYTNLVKFCPFILKILNKNRIMTSIVAELREFIVYNYVVC